MQRASAGRRLAAAAALVVVLLGVPVLAGWLAAGSAGASSAGLGAVFTTLLMLRTGTRVAQRTVPLLLLVIAVAALVAGTWWWVALLAVIGVVAGLGSPRGLTVPTALCGVLAASTPALAPGEGLLARLAVAGVACGYAVFVGHRVGLPAEVPVLRAPPGAGPPVGLVLGTVAGAAGALALLSTQPHAQWIPVTVFLLSMPTPGVRLHRAARSRLLGTAVGLVVVPPVVLLDLPAQARLGLAMVLVLVLVGWPRPLWLSSAVSTAVVVLVLAAPSAAWALGALRLVDVAVATLLVAVGALVLLVWSRRHPLAAGQGSVTGDLVEGQRDVGPGL
jgi:Fusaric acid resistance protein-like